MARKRPGIVAVRRIVAGMCLFLGLFVAFFGIGLGQQSVMVAGVAIMLLALSVRVASSLRRTPREWVRGVGRVIDVSERPHDASFGRCSLQLKVDAPGLPEEIVMVHDSRVPVDQWPRPGQHVPIQVAADDARHVKVLWRDFTAVEMPLEAVWGDDRPGPAPGTPPGSHLDPSPVVDFDLDDPPGKPMQPMRPADVAAPADIHATGTPAGPHDAASPEQLSDATLSHERTTPTDHAGPPDAPGSTDPSPEEPDPGEQRGELASVGVGAAVPPVAAAGPAGPAAAGAQPAEPAAAPGGAGAVPRPRPRPWPRPQPTTATPAEPAAPPSGGPPGHTPATRTAQEPTTEPPSMTAPLGDAPLGDAPLGVGITLLVSELDRSVSFYRDQLEFEELDRGDDTAVLLHGQTRLVLREAADLESVRRRVAHLNIEVRDIDERYAGLRAAGVKFTYPPRPVQHTARLRLWAAAFRDPDGHGVALAEWRRRDREADEG